MLSSGRRTHGATRLSRALCSARVRIRADAIILAQHKPFSFLSPSSSPAGNKRFARDLLVRSNLRGTWAAGTDPRDAPGLQCAGRLDADSTGLLVWTDDDRLAQHIIGPGTPVEKEYLVRCEGHEQWSDSGLEDTLQMMRDGGIHLDGKPLRPAAVERLNDAQLRFTLREGRHRQIRRVCEMFGLRVTAIKRVRIGNLRLASLRPGYWTPLSPANAASLLLRPQQPAARGRARAEGESGEARPAARRRREERTANGRR